ncbi:DUF3291 domain-containing protein [Phytohabitans sp. ZYX-F-186]|uniref:DUF3291 domain-containing protein n=1 Tax=Phytohabitans maris TaxID=3071409 RepID=A0ABU0ZJY8_9ACTN|nr:DUF3291 domain-containing protein [Phytohabitans sp. ZYX-F-186]MDQ7907366.1 DUF3291 domain-containing protein [Phytohabitans sp. ZYX-F-186]
MSDFHLAQLNVAYPRAPLDDPAMAGFVADLALINARADEAPGFVWRLVGEDSDDATALRPFGPDLMVNMSVWESVEALRDFAYRDGVHLESLRRRREWFSHEGLGSHLVLWWIPAGTLPTLDEARERLALLDRDGPGPAAFTLREPYPALRTSVIEAPFTSF